MRGRGARAWGSSPHNATAVLFNGLGDYERALTAARQGARYPAELAFSSLVLPELVEAAVRSGSPELATDALEQLVASTGASGTHWALGIEARSRALLSERDVAESYYREAINHLGRTRMRMELGRAHLLYGEWLRRAGRRLEAREHLRTAHDMFTAMGAEAFAERSSRELLASGETARKRTADTLDDLTAQEQQIARLVRYGLSNSGIGARLFLSPRTIEWHLHNVYAQARHPFPPRAAERAGRYPRPPGAGVTRPAHRSISPSRTVQQREEGVNDRGEG